MNEPKKEKSFVIKVPVFTSELIAKANDLFGGVTYAHMNEHVHKKVNQYNTTNEKAFKNRRNKVQKKEIDQITCIDCKIGNRSCVLLKISAYNTNLHDGFVETDRKIKLGHSDKIGSENNYVLLVPHIFGVDLNNYKHQWLILVYEDPHKDSYNILGTAKLVLSQVLEIQTANIKLPEIIDELRIKKNAPALSLNYTSIDFDENEVDAKYRSYLVGGRFRKQKIEDLENVPFETAEEIIHDNSFLNHFQKRIVKIGFGKKEYRITRQMHKDANERFSEAVEEVYNATIGVSESQLDNIFDEKFIIDILTDVLNEYIR